MSRGYTGSIRSADLRHPWSSARRLQSTLSQLGVSETQRFLVLSLVIGIFSGLLIVLFHIFIDFTSWSTLGALAGRYRFARLISTTSVVKPSKAATCGKING